MAKSVKLKKIALIIVITGMFSLAVKHAATDNNLPQIVLEVSKKKGWVTVVSSFTRSEGSYIAVKIGEEKKVVYRGNHRHPRPGPVSVSANGKKLVFAQFVDTTGSEQAVRKICTIGIDGSEYSEVLDIKDIFHDIAWSHDQRKIAFLGELKDGFLGLVVLDVSTRPSVMVARRPLPRGISFMKMTSQAWAPDNERLVYVNANGRMVIFNVRTNSEDDVGPGDEPTWSRAGAFIAYRADESGKPPGDYFRMSLVPPRRSERLLSNSRSAADIRESRGHYLGPPIWSPDDRFMMIMRIIARRSVEFEQAYVVDVSTRASSPLPPGSMGDIRSWGGHP